MFFNLKKSSILFLFILLFLSLGFFNTHYNALPAMAANPLLDQVKQGGLDDIGSKAFGTTSPQDPRQIIAKVIRTILGFLGFIFVALLIYAGFKWMTAAGNDKNIDEAKSLLKNALIGLIIVITAYSVTYFVSQEIVEETILTPTW